MDRSYIPKTSVSKVESFQLPRHQNQEAGEETKFEEANDLTIDFIRSSNGLNMGEVRDRDSEECIKIASSPSHSSKSSETLYYMDSQASLLTNTQTGTTSVILYYIVQTIAINNKLYINNYLI